MWTVIHITNNAGAADNMKRLLESEGHLVQIRGTGGDAGIDGGVFEILVPESEAHEAHDVLSNRIRR